MLRIERLFGSDVLSEIEGRTVIDFGCGLGDDAIELAQSGAAHVIGIDIRESMMKIGRENARAAGLTNVVFTANADRKADVIFSINAFEHFDDPDGALRCMASLLNPGGKVFLSFSPPWLHPFGGHIAFIPFLGVLPWGHVLLPERLICWWRSFYRNDGAKQFREVEGGLSQMTIRRFEKIVRNSPVCFQRLQYLPIKFAGQFHSLWTREFLTSTVRCELVMRVKSYTLH